MATTSRGLSIGGRATSGEHDCLRTNELGFELRLTVFEEEGYHLPKIRLELIERFALGMGAGPARDVSDVRSCVRISFNDSSVGAHGGLLGDTQS